jgi:hypothetical protein
MKKEISLEEEVKNDLDNVRKIITSSRVENNDNFYSTIAQLFTDGVRNTDKYLNAFETALSIFDTASTRIRTDMDIYTLEQRNRSINKSIDERIKSLQENMDQSLDTITKAYMSKDIQKVLEEVKETSMTEVIELSKDISDGIFMSNRYSLYFAGLVGLELLGINKKDTNQMFSFGATNDISKKSDDLSSILSKEATKKIQKLIYTKKEKNEKVPESELKDTLGYLFTSWVNQFSWDTFKDIAENHDLTDSQIKYENFSITNGQFKQKHDTIEFDDRVMNISREDVLGISGYDIEIPDNKTVEEVLSGSRLLARTLEDNIGKTLFWDNERKINPANPVGKIFTHGGPGTGKTYTAHAFFRYGGDIAKQYNKALKALTLNITDFASHYQNQSANKLAEIMYEISAFPGSVLMYIADVDTILQNRASEPTQEQQQIMSVLFKLFDGSVIPNGKMLAVMDANYIERIDNAYKSRLFDKMIGLTRWDNPEDFGELVKRTLTKNTEGIILKDQDWLDVGTYLLNTELSNREIGHVVNQLKGGYTMPLTLLNEPHEKIIEYRNEQLKSVNKDKIIDKFGNYINTRMEIERKSHEAKMKQKASQLLVDIKTEYDGAEKIPAYKG